MDSTTTVELSDVDTAPEGTEGTECAFCGAPAEAAAEWDDGGYRFWVWYCRPCFEREVPSLPDPPHDGDEPLVVLEPELDKDGLPTVKGFLQLCEWAREKLEAEEPGWTPKRRERVARAMAEAYCQGAVHRVSMERGWA